MAEHLLVVDDDEDIRELLDTYLSGFGFEVSTAADGAQMRDALGRHPVDLVLLDLGLPGEDGLSLARYLREHADVGIIIVTGRGQAVDRVVGLELGADDYVSKPFDLRELAARIRSVLRRIRSAPAAAAEAAAPDSSADRLAFEGWTVDLPARALRDPAGQTVPLTTGEFDLLAVFVRNPNRALTRDELMNEIHRRDAGPFDRAIDVQVGRLRRKIERDPANPERIKAVRGIGYIFTPRVQGS